MAAVVGDQCESCRFFWPLDDDQGRGECRRFPQALFVVNDIVRPVHAKAMPVILTREECDAWLEADVDMAVRWQRPLPADRLSIVAKASGRMQNDVTVVA